MNTEQQCPDDAILLSFEGQSTIGLTQFWADYEGHQYFVHYKYGWLTVELDMHEELFEQKIGEERWHDGGHWNDEETNVYLTLISEAIRQDSFSTLRLPAMQDAQNHILYRKGRIPTHVVGIVCGKTTPTEAPPLTGNRHERKKILRFAKAQDWHYHKPSCYHSVPACEVAQWIAEHPQEHAALLEDEAREIKIWQFWRWHYSLAQYFNGLSAKHGTAERP